MSTFYGQVKGMRGSASRTGSRKSNIFAALQSYDGSVQTQLYYDKDDELCITASYAEGSNMYGDIVFNGTVKQFRKMCEAEMREGRFA